MKRHLFAAAGLLALSSFPGFAQFGYDPVMVNNWANIYLNTEINRITINSGRAGSSSPADQSRPTPSINDIEVRVQVAALESLRPGLHRHWREEGKAKATQWYVRSAGRIGREMGGLLGEYNRRLGRAGQAAADAWYIRSAQQSGARISAED
ncbi:hypothetical protein [Shinella sp.]|uniref:hypothetical protein n=1 Tax=Shinella sp. TaxID=1870904 RepID=UPI0039E59888